MPYGLFLMGMMHWPYIYIRPAFILTPLYLSTSAGRTLGGVLYKAVSCLGIEARFLFCFD